MSLDNKNKKRVFVAMSGGVDSSVAAMLLKNQGYDVVGVFMRCFNLDGCAEKDAEDARRVAEKLNILFYVWDFEEEYKKRVVEYMVDGYRQGLTPNPDVMCNKEIKFGLFLEKALALGADYVATGHYVSLGYSSRNRGSISSGEKLPAASRHFDPATAGTKLKMPPRASSKNNLAPLSLYEAKDKNKDQSYFLWTLTQEQLRHCLFPIGDYLKPEVREIARKAGLPTADKKDSQGICFLGKVTLADFLKAYIPEKRGEVLTASGDKIGEHSGTQFYTIGQRHLGVNFSAKGGSASGGQFLRSNFQNNTNRRPYYVIEKDIETNSLTVAEGSDNPALYKKEIELNDVNLISPELRTKNNKLKVFARVRYRQPLAKAMIVSRIKYHVSSNKKNSKNLIPDTCHITLIFDEPQKFVAAGQSAVFYEMSPSTGSGLKMLGGGVII